MQFSTRKTLARNSARVSAVAGISLTIGASLYMLIASSSEHPTGEQTEYRNYGEAETKLMYAALSSLLLLSFCLHCLLPNREVKDSVTSQSPHTKTTVSAQVGTVAATLVDTSMLKLIPVLINHGIFSVFSLTIYPSALQYSSTLSNEYPSLTAYYAFAMFFGTTACGLVVEPLSKCFHDFGLRPLYFFTLSMEVIALILCCLTVPDWATAEPTHEGAFITPNLPCVLLISFLLGLIDSTTTAANTVYCSRILPGRASHTYAAGRFYIGTSSALISMFAPKLSMTYHALIQTVFIGISVFAFSSAASEIDRLERSEESSLEKTAFSYEAVASSPEEAALTTIPEKSILSYAAVDSSPEEAELKTPADSSPVEAAMKSIPENPAL